MIISVLFPLRLRIICLFYSLEVPLTLEIAVSYIHLLHTKWCHDGAILPKSLRQKSMCILLCVRQRERVCVSEWKRERERERKRDGVSLSLICHAILGCAFHLHSNADIASRKDCFGDKKCILTSLSLSLSLSLSHSSNTILIYPSLSLSGSHHLNSH